MLGSIFNSENFSRNFITCGFFAFKASFYTQINFSITITSICTGSKENRIHFIIQNVDSRWLMVPDISLTMNNIIMSLLLLVKIVNLFVNFLILSNTLLFKHFSL